MYMAGSNGAFDGRAALGRAPLSLSLLTQPQIRRYRPIHMVNTMPLTLSLQRPGGCCVDVDSVDAVRSEHCVSGIQSRWMRKAQKNSRSSHNLEQDLRCRAPLPAGRKNWCTLPLYILWIRRVLRRLRALWHGPQSGRSCCSRRTRWVRRGRR